MRIDRLLNFRFSLFRLLTLVGIASPILWLNTFGDITCRSWAGMGCGDALQMRHGWPMPFLQSFERADGNMGSSRIASGWPPNTLERDFLLAPFAINPIVWITIILFAMYLTIGPNRRSAGPDNSAN